MRRRDAFLISFGNDRADNVDGGNGRGFRLGSEGEGCSMRKRLLVVALLAAVTLMFGLAGCGSGDTEGREAQEDVEGLPAWADEAAVTAQARDAIDLFVAGDYEGLASLFGDPAPAASDFEKAARAAEDVGGFESYGDVSFANYDGSADGMAAIVVQQAHCENDDLVYSVGIAEDGRLVGFRLS